MNPFKGRHFQRDIILWAVRWYCKYGISYLALASLAPENLDNSKNTPGSDLISLW